MKKTIIVLILALSINTFAQTRQPIYNFQDQTFKQGALIQKFDSIYHWAWSKIDNTWFIYTKDIDMVYDDNNNLTSQTGQVWNDSFWVNFEKYTSTFDANQNRTTYMYQMWIDKSWFFWGRDTFTFDGNNNLTCQVRQFWGDSNWVNGMKNSYTYDANNNQKSKLSQEWKVSTWENTDIHSFNYDAKNNMINEIIKTWDMNGWLNNCKIIFTYDAKNNKSTRLWQFWEENTWVNGPTDSFIYDANSNLLFELDYNGSMILSKFTYMYDANNNLISKIHEVSTSDSNLVIDYKESYTYDDNNFKKSFTHKEWEKSDSFYYYYQTMVGINDLTKHLSEITIYPNPNRGKFVINSNSAINSIEVYNLTGKLLYSDYNLKRQTSVDIDLTNLQKGIYFARIQDRKQVITEKIIIQ